VEYRVLGPLEVSAGAAHSWRQALDMMARLDHADTDEVRARLDALGVGTGP
jgi:hypothetical protein